MTWAELAKAVGRKPCSIHNLRRNRKDAPKAADVEAWKAFIDTMRPRDTPVPFDGSDISNDYHAQKIRLTRAQADKLEMANALKKGTLMPRADSDAAWRKFASWLTPFIRRKLENQLPATMPGMTPAEARICGKALVDEIIAAFNGAHHKVVGEEEG